MKFNSILRLSWKNLWANISRSLLTIISITMLSVVVITLSNFCYYYKVTTNDGVLQFLKDEGVDVILFPNADSNADKLNNTEVELFLEHAKRLNIVHKYEITVEDTIFTPYLEDKILLKPYIQSASDIEPILLLNGNDWTSEYTKKEDIFLSKNVSDERNINIGDEFIINSDKGIYKFIVKGILEGDTNFIDYSFFNIKYMKIFDTVNSYETMEIIYEIDNLNKVLSNEIKISGSVLEEYHNVQTKFAFILGICIFLIVFCIVLSMSSILNTLKISIENRNTSIVLMKTLGMRNNKLFLYIFLQMSLLILLSTLAATVVAVPLAYLSLARLLDNVIMYFEDFAYAGIKSGFNFILPLLNISILLLSVFLGTFKMLNRFLTKDIVELINEVQ